MSGSGLLTTQKAARPHLTRGSGGVAGEVNDLRRDLESELAPMAAITVEEFTNAAGADADAIKLAVASSDSAVVYSGSELDGLIGEGEMSPPRNLTVTTAGVTPADAPATATIEGLDVNGDVISETINVPQTGTSQAGVKAFAKVTSISLPAGQGDQATLAFGFGALIGLAKPIKTRGGLTGAIREIAGGSLVTNGVFAPAATGAPNGTYAPNTPPDGSTDYAIYYEYDPTA